MRASLLIVGLVGGLILLLRMNSSGVSLVGDTRKGSETKSPPAWAENARLVGLHSAQKRPRTATPRLKTANVDRTHPVPLTTYEVIVPFPGFPTETDLRSARFRSELLNKYGPGDVNAAWVDHGVMYEKFIYFSPGKSIEVLVEDGQVIDVSK
jgi:hypothetical protein